MATLSNYPNENQLNAGVNKLFDCVPASIDDGLEFLTGKRFGVEAIKSAAYGPDYVGATAASAYVPFCAEQGVRLFAIDGNGTQLVQAVHEQIQQEHPVIATEPDVYALAHPDWSHVISFYSESPGSLTARDPFGAHDVTHTDAEWARLFEFNEIWAMEKMMANTIPANWTDDGTTLTAPNGFKVVRGFRDYVLAHNWDERNVPIEDEVGMQKLEASDPTLGGGTRQTFNWTMLEWTTERGVFIAWAGKELLYTRQQYAQIYTAYQQLKAQFAQTSQPAQPPAPDPMVQKLKDRLQAVALQADITESDAAKVQQLATSPIV